MLVFFFFFLMWCIKGRNYFGLMDGVNVREFEFVLKIIILLWIDEDMSHMTLPSSFILKRGLRI